MTKEIIMKPRREGKSWSNAIMAVSALGLASDKTLHSLARCYPDHIKELFKRFDEALCNKSKQQIQLMEEVEVENRRLKRMLDQQTKVILQLRSDKLDNQA